MKYTHLTFYRCSKIDLLSKRSCSFAAALENKGYKVTNASLLELKALLRKPQVVYCGFDPTAPSLHVGNLLAIVGLIHFQRFGHQPIALIGGATALIGDPTHRTVEREKLDERDAIANSIRIKETIENVFENHRKYHWKGNHELKSVIICNNKDWYDQTNIINFLYNSGCHFRMNELLSRSSVKTRMESSDGMSLTEFVYQVFQSHDWLHLYEKYGCRLQLGGSDQTGNILSGLHLINKLHNDSLMGVTVPLLTSESTGNKIGKSSGGHSLWLCEDMTSPFGIYQYFYNLWDSEVERFLRLLTFLSEEDIEAIKNEDTSDRMAQRILGEHVVLLLHGQKGLDSALRCTRALFGSSLEDLDKMSEREIQTAFPGAKIVGLKLNSETTMSDLVQATGHCQQMILSKRPNTNNNTLDANSKFKSKKLILEGAVKLNFEKICDPTFSAFNTKIMSNSQWSLLTISKKHHYIINWL